MSKFLHGLQKGIATIDKGLHHARDEAIGLFNPNRRHDDPAEIQADEARAEIRSGHRFTSFAAERAECSVKWHIDGHDYMYALSELLESAKESVFILDWWLTPELYLRRPPAKFPEYRLDTLLARKAAQGVKVYIIVYKEVTQTMSMCSSHTKNYLESLHENIVVLRHPDHIGSKDTVEFWSHHEKVVVVDNHFACIGGLDLCFGRWDSHNHPLADVHPTDFGATVFVGQDYNNARVMDFQNVWSWASNGLGLTDTARMPWHDVHMTLSGVVVLDIAQHFIERWNEVRKRKYKTEPRVPLLALPHDTESHPNEAVARHPHRDVWREKGFRFTQGWHGWGAAPERNGAPQDGSDWHPHPNPATCRVQAVRSVSDWSHGVLTERSIQDAYIQLINESNHFIYIENQFFISATASGGQVTNLIAQALVQRIIRAKEDDVKFKVIVVIPEVPGFPGNVKDESSLKIIMAAQYRTMNRGGSSIYEELRKAGIEPMDYIRFYHLRAYDRINAPRDTYIAQIEQNSGVTFNEAQIAYARVMIGRDTGDQKEITVSDVKIRVNEPTTEALAPPSNDKVKTVTVPLPSSLEEAKEKVKRFEEAAKAIRGDEQVSDSVAQHLLQDSTTLADEKWLGNEAEEKEAYVSELLYIHTKLMIVDDRRVIMGSANINDRSQKGDGDSEIALVVEDTDFVNTTMNGQSYMASRFAASLRIKLFREHLGLIPPQPATSASEPDSFMHPAPTPSIDEFEDPNTALVLDPLSDKTQDLWNNTARTNREIFTEIFRPVPSNLVRDWKAYDAYVPKIKTGHVVPDISLARIKERLALIKGSLVECPLDFLIDEKGFVEGNEWKGLDPTLPIYI
ncbi:phospholipase D [Mycena floridula]|nr:phospholipase D [Mycena floridula]